MMECRKAFCAGMLTSRALIFTSSTSCSSISSRSSGSITHPRLLKLCRCDPATAMYTLLIITSLFCSASTTASCTHFMAVSKSTISPFRTPREGASPTPRILSVPSGRLSPTTTQILEVPISRPTIKLLFAIIFVSFLLLVTNCLWCGGRSGARFWRRRPRFVSAGILANACFKRMHRDCFHDPRLHGRRDSIIDHRRRWTGKCYRNVPLRYQVHSLQLLLGLIAIIKEHLQPPQLVFQIIQRKHDAAVVFIRHQEIVTFRNIDFADLKARL